MRWVLDVLKGRSEGARKGKERKSGKKMGGKKRKILTTLPTDVALA